jgi:hypothetical protein
MPSSKAAALAVVCGSVSLELAGAFCPSVTSTVGALLISKILLVRLTRRFARAKSEVPTCSAAHRIIIS